MSSSGQKVTEWYFSEQIKSFGAILRNGVLSVVFFGIGDLSVV